jgi:hypothetical protein
MNGYRLSESFCAKKPLPGLILVAALVTPIIPLVFLSVMSSQPDLDVKLQPIFMLVAFPAVLLLVFISLYFSYRRQRSILQKFRIFLERDCLTRIAPYFADLSLFRDEVLEIVETQGVGVVVFPRDRGRCIFVPAGLVGYDEVRATLSQWTEIKVRPKRPLRQWASLGATALLIGVGVATYVLESPYLVLPLGSVFIAAVLYCLWVIQRSPQLGFRIKLYAWAVFFPIFSIAMKMALACGLLNQP